MTYVKTFEELAKYGAELREKRRTREEEARKEQDKRRKNEEGIKVVKAMLDQLFTAVGYEITVSRREYLFDIEGVTVFASLTWEEVEAMIKKVPAIEVKGCKKEGMYLPDSRVVYWSKDEKSKNVQ